MNLNAQNLGLLTQAVMATFMTGLGTSLATAGDWKLLAMEVPSNTGENIYPYLKTLGGIRKWVGDREIQNMDQGDFRIKNEPYEETHGIPREAIEDDQYGLYMKLFEQTAHNVAVFPSEKVFGHLKAGFTTLGPDGQFFFDVDHPVGEPGKEVSVSNFMGGSGEPWFILDASQVLKPMVWQPRRAFDLVSLFNPTDPNVFFRKEYIFGVDGRAGFGFTPFWQMLFASRQTLDAANLRATLTAMSTQKANNGKPLAVKGTHLICSPTLGETARDLMTKERLANGESNTLRNRLQVVETPWLL
jgi:phage major head subunit gpT-like protein